MSATIAISFAGNKKGFVKLKKYTKEMKPNLRRGLQRAGAFLEGALKKKLKQSNPTTFFYKSTRSSLSSRTGRLRGSITHQMGKASGGDFVRIGPNVVYGAVHEFGANINVTDKMRAFLHYKGIHLRKSTTKIKIPKRAWFFPTVQKNHNKIVKTIQKEVNRPLR